MDAPETISIRATPAARDFWRAAAKKAGLEDEAQLFQLVFDVGANPAAEKLFAAVTPLVAALAL